MSRVFKIAVLPGDGIGPEVTEAALIVLDALLDSMKGLQLRLEKAEAGYECIRKYGTNLPPETLDVIRGSDACLKGPMTTPEEPGSPTSVAVTLRKYFDLYANIRPCKSLPRVPCLKPNIDLIIVRENTEGLYSGKEFEISPGVGVALRIITNRASERIARVAFELAMRRKRKVSFVHKANVLKLTDGIFKEGVLKVAKEYPGVELEELHVDAMAMQLIKRPESFDVIVTTNMFGDILSDEAAQTVGGLGLAAGANIGDRFGMFEPVHGSAPKYAGQNKVNPMAMIFASKMMLEYLGLKEAAERVEKAVLGVLEEGKFLTYDLGGSSTTMEVARAIAEKIKA
ncbi:MAG: isocitrate/isopropylmalate dehydrogenase family protein [Candidatus Bathyarchaeia archaeon]